MTTPFLKWAGGKRWLASAELLPIPSDYERYIEPFLGGAAVFFSLCPDRAILSDINPDLIGLYQIIKSDPAGLQNLMEVHQELHDKDYYYKMRAYKPRCELRKAARFLYLNRTCWNGLYRVNIKGDFNVPIGTKDAVVLDTDDFKNVSKTLKNATLKCVDFEKSIDQADEGDFLFLDPPYTVKHNYNGFIKYNEKIFSWDDQVRLQKAVVRAASRGVYIAITNADHNSIHQLYEGIGKYIQLQRHSVLAGSADKRIPTTEAMYLINISDKAMPPTISAGDIARSKAKFHAKAK